MIRTFRALLEVLQMAVYTEGRGTCIAFYYDIAYKTLLHAHLLVGT